jgi:fibro-slime domain-containing protein
VIVEIHPREFFMSLPRAIAGPTGLLVLFLFGLVSSAAAQTMSVTWYTVSSSDPDRPFPYSGGAVVDDEVLSALGPGNLPEYNSAYGGPAIHDLVSIGGGIQEITWWSPAHDPDVTQTGTGTVSLPINLPCTSSSNCLYPPNGKGTADAGSSGYEAAVFSATLTPKTTESISFSIGADDVAFAYLNGQIVCDLGGVHPDAPGTCTSGTLSAGSTNSLEIFYADLRPAAAAFNFSIETTNVSSCPSGTSGPNCTPVTTGTGVPEPLTLGLMSFGFAALGCVRRRRSRAG